MSATQQSQAISDANTIMGLASQMVGLYSAISAVNQSWNDHSALTVLQAMGTMAQNADGTLGAADGSPNGTHPLNTTLYPALARAISSGDLGSILTQLNNIVSFINGGALAATPGVRAVLNKATGG